MGTKFIIQKERKVAEKHTLASPETATSSPVGITHIIEAIMPYGEEGNGIGIGSGSGSIGFSGVGSSIFFQ